MRLSTLSVGSIFTSEENFNVFCLILKSMSWSSLQTTHTCIQICVLSAQTWETEILHFPRSSQILAVSSSWAFCYLLSENDKVMDRWGAPLSATLWTCWIYLIYRIFRFNPSCWVWYKIFCYFIDVWTLIQYFLHVCIHMLLRQISQSSILRIVWCWLKGQLV